MTLKESIESFTYPHLEYLTQIMIDGGEDAQWMGIPCLSDNENFTGGALLLCCSRLLVYQSEHAPEKAEETMRRWLTFAGWAAANPMQTWGKLSALKSLWRLKRAGKWDMIPPELLDKLKERTDYRDFFDAQAMQLRGKATNYLHVAMAVAGYRAKVGFEPSGMAEKIFALFLKHLRDESFGGWMDDSKGFGRFDRYSLLIYPELADTCHALDIPIPQQVKDGVIRSLLAVLDLCSAQGDGVAYGRSLSAHGDMSVLEIASTAAREGWIRQDWQQRVADCCRACLHKALHFWYNAEKRSFDLWFDGRTTNRYRQVHRLMEVNLDLCDHLLVTLENLEAGGMADISMQAAAAAPQAGVDCARTEFAPRYALYALHTPQRIWQLPAVGTGELYRYPAYYPVPMAPRLLELPPENPADGSVLPLALPLAELADGRAAMPVQYFAKSGFHRTAQGVEVEIELESLCIMGGDVPQPLEGSRAVLRYRFDLGGTLQAHFTYVSQSVPIRALHMQWGSPAPLLRQTADGAAFENCTVQLPDWASQPAVQVERDEDYFTPNGPLRWMIACGKNVDGNIAEAGWTLRQE